MRAKAAAANRLVVRLARSAPETSVGSAAASVGVPGARARKALTHLPARGRCGSLAAAAAADPNLDKRARQQAAAWPGLPPGTARTAAATTLAAAHRSSAAWFARSQLRRDPHTADVRLSAGPSRLSASGGAECPPAALHRLATHHDSSVRGQVAENPNTPLYALPAMCDDDILWVTDEVYLRCPPRVLAGAHNDLARVQAAYRADASPDLLRRLAADRTLQVREAAFGNEHCPPEAFDLLTDESDPRVRRRVAASPRCPAGVLRRLAADEDSTTRYSALSNSTLPVGDIVDLAEHPDSAVRSSAIRSDRFPAAALKQVAASHDPHLRLLAAASANTPPATLTRLGGDNDNAVRAAVAANANTDADTIATLATTETDGDILIAALRHPRCSAEALDAAADIADIDLKAAVADHPDTAPRTLSRLSRTDHSAGVLRRVAQHRSCPPEALRALAQRHRLADVRRAVAANPSSPPDTLDQLSKDRQWDIRMIVAQNLSRPAHVLRRLQRDSDPYIRQVARNM